MSTLDQDQAMNLARQLLEVVHRLRRHGPGRPANGEWLAALDELSALAEALCAEEERQRRHDEQAQAAYQEALAHNLRYQELFDFIPDGYLITDGQAIIREANHAAARLLDRRRDFLAGKPLPFFVAPGWRVDFYARLSGLLHQANLMSGWETCLQGV